MKSSFSVALTLACCLTVAQHLPAQSPAQGDPSGANQNKPADDSQKPAASTPKSGDSKSESNPFPEDTSTVPVMPSASSPSAQALPSFSDAENENIRLPGADTDPARSPDDPAADSASELEEGSSSSLHGIDQLLPEPDTGKPRKGHEQEPTHQEGAAEDISVGGYYLDQKDWKGALSRFESALVLDPENPDVYWGLAEAERHLGDYAAARAHYQKVLDYDPDSRHGKEARKALKEPELANAPAVSSNPSAARPQQ